MQDFTVKSTPVKEVEETPFFIEDLEELEATFKDDTHQMPEAIKSSTYRNEVEVKRILGNFKVDKKNVNNATEYILKNKVLDSKMIVKETGLSGATSEVLIDEINKKVKILEDGFAVIQ